ncbi:Uncharacterised protein [Escherichia coli]|nr:Uncharacterised protein [Escherichia coli]
MSKRLFPMNNLCRYSSCHPPSVWLSLGYILYNIGIPFEPIQNITHRVTDVFIVFILILKSIISNNSKLRTYFIITIDNFRIQCIYFILHFYTIPIVPFVIK